VKDRNARAAAEARATARTAAGEAGVAGLSVEALLNDFTAQEGRYRYGGPGRPCAPVSATTDSFGSASLPHAPAPLPVTY
jgi:hypothetical protein